MDFMKWLINKSEILPIIRFFSVLIYECFNNSFFVKSLTPNESDNTNQILENIEERIKLAYEGYFINENILGVLKTFVSLVENKINIDTIEEQKNYKDLSGKNEMPDLLTIDGDEIPNDMIGTDADILFTYLRFEGLKYMWNNNGEFNHTNDKINKINKIIDLTKKYDPEKLYLYDEPIISQPIEPFIGNVKKFSISGSQLPCILTIDKFRETIKITISGKEYKIKCLYIIDDGLSKINIADIIKNNSPTIDHTLDKITYNVTLNYTRYHEYLELNINSNSNKYIIHNFGITDQYIENVSLFYLLTNNDAEFKCAHQIKLLTQALKVIEKLNN